MHSIVDHAARWARIPLGLVFFVFGLNGFLGFLPSPEVPGEAGAFLGALAATGYMFPVIKGIEVAAGVMLLSNRFVPLALLLLAPIVVNIALFHFVLAPSNLGVVFFVIVAGLAAAYDRRAAFRSVLEARPRAARSDERSEARELHPART